MTPAILLHGTDAEVVERMFLGLLGRFPDEAALAHFLPRLRAHGRPAVLAEVLGAEEARRRGAALAPDSPCTPAEADAWLNARRIAVLRDELAALRARPAGPGPEWLRWRRARACWRRCGAGGEREKMRPGRSDPAGPWRKASLAAACRERAPAECRPSQPWMGGGAARGCCGASPVRKITE